MKGEDDDDVVMEEDDDLVFKGAVDDDQFKSIYANQASTINESDSTTIGRNDGNAAETKNCKNKNNN